jgi:hypothetical protein
MPGLRRAELRLERELLLGLDSNTEASFVADEITPGAAAAQSSAKAVERLRVGFSFQG